MRRLAVLAIPIVAVCVLFAAPMASAQDTGSAQVARASSQVAPASTPKCWPGPNIGMYCHDDLTEWVPAIGHWAAPVFCAKKEDWNNVCGWMISNPSWFSCRAHGSTVNDGPESGSYAYWLDTEADYRASGSSTAWGWMSDAWISDDTTNIVAC